MRHTGQPAVREEEILSNGNEGRNLIRSPH